MKKLTVLSALVFLSTFLLAQDVFQWSSPQIITDINSNYSNPFVIPYGSTSLMFYQKNGETSSVYKMDLNMITDNVLLLSSTIYNYKFPYFRTNNNPDFVGHLLYLSDEEGADNLYARKLYEDNSLGISNKVIVNSANNDIMDYDISAEGNITFTIDSLVYGAEIVFYDDSVFTERVRLLDSSSYNIQNNNRQAYWQKQESDSSHILSSKYVYNSDSAHSVWQNPIKIDSVGDNKWLTKSTTVEYWGSNGVCWVKEDSIFSFSDWWSNEIAYINSFSKPNVRQLTMINWYILVKYQYELPHYTCFATGLGEDSEIYSSHGEYGWAEGVYISNNEYQDDNPKLFFGEPWGWDYYVYCIWQTHINGKTALSMAKAIALIGSGLNENHLIDNFLKISPNPFNEKLNISFNTYGKKAKIEIFDIKGNLIYELDNLNSDSDWESQSWQEASNLTSGVYFVVLSLDGKTYARKIIKQ